MIRVGPKTRVALEKPYWTRFWGQRCKCKPVFISHVFGDGSQLLAVQPLNTRPHYYLIRVDSQWNTNGNADGEVIHDHIDEICEAIQEEVGKGGQLDADESPTGRARYAHWPALNDDCGVSWWSEKLIAPAQPHHKEREEQGE